MIENALPFSNGGQTPIGWGIHEQITRATVVAGLFRDTMTERRATSVRPQGISRQWNPRHFLHSMRKGIFRLVYTLQLDRMSWWAWTEVMQQIGGNGTMEVALCSELG